MDRPLTDVVVIGSANRDYLIRVEAIPAAGETVLARSLTNSCGGKGANQAVAASRLGARVSFVGCVGDDADGALLLREMRSEGVDVADVEVLHESTTGRAFVSVDDAGENCIAVVSGANAKVNAAKVRRVVERSDPQSIVVLQGEIPADTVAEAVRSAQPRRVIVNLAPVIALPDDVIAAADPLVLNEQEAATLSGVPVHDAESALEAAAALSPAPTSVVITIGAGGAVWSAEGTSGHEPVRTPVAAIDTTGAGDAFVGALAASLSHGNGLADAVGFGVRAGSYAVSRPGAQASYAYYSDLVPDLV